MNEWNGNPVYSEDDLTAICERSFADSIEAVRTIIRNDPQYAQHPSLIAWCLKYSKDLSKWTKERDAPISPPITTPKPAKTKAEPKAKAPAKAAPKAAKTAAKAKPPAKAKAPKKAKVTPASNPLPQATDVAPEPEPDTVDKFFAD